MQLERRRFPRPNFEDVEKAFELVKTSVHVCPQANPMEASLGADQMAPKVCEALLVANRCVERKGDIARASHRILDEFQFGVHGRMCSHGVALDSAALGDFLTAQWGEPHAFKQLSGPPEQIMGKVGLICFQGIPGHGPLSHIDLWNGSRCLGGWKRWDAGNIRFWEMHAAAGAGDGSTSGGGAGKEETAPDVSWLTSPKPKPTPEKEEPKEPTIDEIIAGLYKKAEPAKVEIDALADKVAAEFGGQVAKAPLKSKKRIIEKANDDYEGDVTRVKDIARNTTVVPAGKELDALKRLRELNPAIADKQVVVVDGAKDPCGYSGIKVLSPTSNGMPGEMQINSPHMIFAKEKPDDAIRILGKDQYEALASKPGMPEGGKGHLLYEDYRTCKDPEQKAKIAAESRAYYSAVRTAVGGS